MSHIILNKVLHGQKGSYRIIKTLTQNVFQAQIVGTSSYIAIKTAPEPPELFLNEVDMYQHDCIDKSPYIRSRREYINSDECHCLALEWMDNTLWETKNESNEAKARVFKIVTKSCLKALALFQDIDGLGECVHGDLNPNNILVSGFAKSTTIAKVADLGWTMRAGSEAVSARRIQGDAIRAPEIWKGELPTAACDIWSLGVSLAHWMSSRIMFGVGGCNIKSNHPQEVTEAAWSIAKLHRMRGAQLEGPIADEFLMEWAIADNILSQNLLQTPTVRDELIQKHVSPECIAFIEHLLVVDSRKRPSAIQALSHPFLKG